MARQSSDRCDNGGCLAGRGWGVSGEGVRDMFLVGASCVQGAAMCQKMTPTPPQDTRMSQLAGVSGLAGGVRCYRAGCQGHVSGWRLLCSVSCHVPENVPDTLARHEDVATCRG